MKKCLDPHWTIGSPEPLGSGIVSTMDSAPALSFQGCSREDTLGGAAGKAAHFYGTPDTRRQTVLQGEPDSALICKSEISARPLQLPHGWSLHRSKALGRLRACWGLSGNLSAPESQATVLSTARKGLWWTSGPRSWPWKHTCYPHGAAPETQPRPASSQLHKHPPQKIFLFPFCYVFLFDYCCEGTYSVWFWLF